MRLAVVQALGSLRATDEGWVTQHLRDVAEDDPDGEVRREARHTLAPPDRIIGCVFEVPPPGGSVLIAPDGAASVRCHDGPGIEPPLERARRLPSGLVVGEYDRFDDGESMWLLVGSGENNPCWLPADQVRRERPDDAEDAPASTSDFDMPLAATLDESFLALEEHGIVETFDRGSTLVGVRLTVDPSDAEALAVLREADEWAHTPLGEAVRAFLPAVLERHGSRDGWDAWWRSDAGPESE